jgi:hypothetical protein
MINMVEVAKEIESLEDEDGNVSKKAVVEKARDPVSAMHGAFTWDTNKAAEERWLEQAAVLIRRVKIEVTFREAKLDCVRYVRNATVSNEYSNILRVRTNEDRSRTTVLDEMMRVTQAAKRARAVVAVLGSPEQVDQIIELARMVAKSADAGDPAAGSA